MIDIDLHTHTRFFHQFAGRPTAFDALGFRMNVAVARARDLDAIAVTNHDYFTSFDVDTGDLAIIPGIEVSTSDGHLLVIGPNPPERTVAGELTPQETVAAARERDCAVVMAHPFRAGTVKDADVAVDAVEVNGKHPQTAEMVEVLANNRSLPLVGGSDAHYPIEVGRVVTNFDIDEANPDSVVRAIKAGNTDFQVVERFPDQYTRKLYAAIHRLKRRGTTS
jgi:predicted metal-dependent phosphoesterase TrpH